MSSHPQYEKILKLLDDVSSIANELYDLAKDEKLDEIEAKQREQQVLIKSLEELQTDFAQNTLPTLEDEDRQEMIVGLTNRVSEFQALNERFIKLIQSQNTSIE